MSDQPTKARRKLGVDSSDWWSSDDHHSLKSLKTCILVDDRVDRDKLKLLFEQSPPLLLKATQLWMTAANGRILQTEREVLDQEFEILTWCLCVHADSLGIYVPNIWALAAMLDPIVTWNVHNSMSVMAIKSKPDPDELRRLFLFASGEILRLRSATPALPNATSSLGYRSHSANIKKTRNDDRDAFMYQRATQPSPPTWREIRKEAEARGWGRISSDQTARVAVQRYAKRHKLNTLPERS